MSESRYHFSEGCPGSPEGLRVLTLATASGSAIGSTLRLIHQYHDVLETIKLRWTWTHEDGGEQLRAPTRFPKICAPRGGPTAWPGTGRISMLENYNTGIGLDFIPSEYFNGSQRSR